MEKAGLTFPCEYPIRVIGLDENDFLLYVMQVVSRHIPATDPQAFTTRSSRKANYLSISVTVTAESRAQLDALYRELATDPRVKFTL